MVTSPKRHRECAVRSEMGGADMGRVGGHRREKFGPGRGRPVRKGPEAGKTQGVFFYEA